MNFPLFIARRYLFAKKTTNAINAIAAVTVLGVAVCTAVFVALLSIFNGFEDLIGSRFGLFNPAIKITPAAGKVFEADSLLLSKIRNIEGVGTVCPTLEEVALFAREQRQVLGILKGVDRNFKEVSNLDTALSAGEMVLVPEGGRSYATFGGGITDRLGIGFNQAFVPEMNDVTVYMAKRQTSGGLLGGQPFKTRVLYPSGVFELLQDFENHAITDIAFARELLGYNENEVSALELSLKQDASSDKVERLLEQALGDTFVVKNRYAQDEAFFKVTNMEKWISYAILTFTLLLIAFNMVGTLTMLVIEKRTDIGILRSMGATDGDIRSAFLWLGALLTGLGALVGFTIGIAFCVGQRHFGFISLDDGSGNFIIEAYPIAMRWADFLLVFVTVMVIGLAASWLPAARAANTPVNLKAA